MANSFNELLELIKRIVVDTLNSLNPTHVVFGTIKTVAPLTIQLEQQEIIPQEMIALSRNVTDFTTDMTVAHLTETRAGGSGDSSFASHNHEYKGRKSFLVHKSLQVGDKVVLLRVQGGQKYVVMDRVVAI